MRGGTFAQVKPDVSKLEAWAHTIPSMALGGDVCFTPRSGHQVQALGCPL